MDHSLSRSMARKSSLVRRGGDGTSEGEEEDGVPRTARGTKPRAVKPELVPSLPWLSILELLARAFDVPIILLSLLRETALERDVFLRWVGGLDF